MTRIGQRRIIINMSTETWVLVIETLMFVGITCVVAAAYERAKDRLAIAEMQAMARAAAFRLSQDEGRRMRTIAEATAHIPVEPALRLLRASCVALGHLQRDQRLRQTAEVAELKAAVTAFQRGVQDPDAIDRAGHNDAITVAGMKRLS